MKVDFDIPVGPVARTLASETGEPSSNLTNVKCFGLFAACFLSCKFIMLGVMYGLCCLRLTRQNSVKNREKQQKLATAQENAYKLRHVSPRRLRSASETIFGTSDGKETILDLLQSRVSIHLPTYTYCVICDLRPITAIKLRNALQSSQKY